VHRADRLGAAHPPRDLRLRRHVAPAERHVQERETQRLLAGFQRLRDGLHLHEQLVHDAERDRDDDVVGGERWRAVREVEARGGPAPVEAAEAEAQPDGARRERRDEAVHDAGVPVGDRDVVAGEVLVFALRGEVEVVGGGVRPLPVDLHRQQGFLDVLQLLVA
jgi:hypothetical protein